jgi:DNA polymerase
MFIGEAPGFHEDQQGRPFVGPSGQLLNKLLEAIKLPREEVFIANVVKCHPPQNLDPTPEQMAACKPYLDRQIAAINPRLIVTLGRFSMARYWPGQYISQIHGQVKQADGRLYLPMFHPSAALRDRDRTLPKFKADGLQIPDLLVRAEELARNEIWGYPVTEESEPPAPARPLSASARQLIADATAIFETKASPEPLKEEAERPAPFVAPVAETLQAEEAPVPTSVAPVEVLSTEALHPEAEAPAQTVQAALEVSVAPEKKAPRPKKAKAAPAPVEKPNDPADLTALAAQAEVAPGLSLAEAGQTERSRKTPGDPAKPRKKRPAAPGEQLTMF